MTDVVYLNGSIIDAEFASIAINDAGFLHGAGLFETMRAHHGRPFQLPAHIRRINTSAREIGLNLHLDENLMAEAVAELLDARQLTDARLRLTLSTGAGSTDLPAEPLPTVLITAGEWKAYPEQLYQTGMQVVISELFQNPRSVTCGHKTISYLDRITSLQKARAARAGESLWFTEVDKQLAEGAISNVFLVSTDGTIRTPPLRWDKFPQFRLILPGIARGIILDLAQSLALTVVETPLNIRDVLDAREVFLTNIIMGVMPVCHVEQHVIGSGTPGEISSALRSRFNSIAEAPDEKA